MTTTPLDVYAAFQNVMRERLADYQAGGTGAVADTLARNNTGNVLRIAQSDISIAYTDDASTNAVAAATGGKLGTELAAANQKYALLIGHLGDSTTSVATLAYEFFTGKTPTSAGYDYLVHSSANATDLNDAYYAQFNMENRYINFASNLGKVGEGSAAFQAAYGGLSLLDATAKAYTTIFGTTPTADKVHALIDTRVDYFVAYGQDGPNGIGTKAAVVGWLLAEAVKADTGTYATANDGFLVALASGTAAYNTDLLATYGHAPVGVVGQASGVEHSGL